MSSTTDAPLDIDERPKRNRKPKVPFVPEDFSLKSKPSGKKGTQEDRGKASKAKDSTEKKPKNRNSAESGSTENKWKTYRDTIKKYISYLLKNMHVLEINFTDENPLATGIQKKNILDEKLKVEKKIFHCKQAIMNTLQSLANENSDDKRWPQLAVSENNGKSHRFRSSCTNLSFPI
jgi:hypothetical protein